MITIFVRQIAPVVAIGALLGLVIRLQTAPPPSADMWFHLRFGHEFLAHWRLHNPGHLGAYDTAQWIPTQWLTQEVMAWTEVRAGVAGLMWATGVLVMLLAVIVFAGCRLLASPLAAAAATSLAVMAALPGFGARPQLLSYLFVTLTTIGWLLTARDGRPRYWLLAVAWVWPMLHGMWPVGISISAAAALGLALERTLPTPNLLRVLAIPVLSCVCALLNPLGLDVVRALVAVGDRSQYFMEWGPTDFTTLPALVLATLLIVVLTSAMRSPRVHWMHVMLSLLALVWALFSLRTTPVAALMLAPFAGAALQRLIPESGPITPSERFSLLGMLAVGAVVMVPVAHERAMQPVVPDWVDKRLDGLPSGTRILNDWDTGAYFLFRHRDLDYVMHGYGDVFTESELDRNANITHLGPGWLADVDALDVDTALLNPDSSLGYALESSPGWSVIEKDSSFVLLRRQDRHPSP